MMKYEFFQIAEPLPVNSTIHRQTDRPFAEEYAASAALPAIYLRMAGTQAKETYHYALHIAGLLDAQIHYLPRELKDLSLPAGENNKLLIYEEPEQSWLKTWFYGPPGSQIVNRWPDSVLVARQPRWPLKKILLVTRGRLLDYTAVTWAAHLAQSVQADLAVLAVQPYLSTVESGAVCGDGLETWLASDTPLGQQLRYLAKAQGTVNGCLDLQFRGGSSDDQIRQAVAETQPDLIVIAAEPVDWYERRILGELVTPLLRRVDRPVLVTKSNCGTKGGKQVLSQEIGD